MVCRVTESVAEGLPAITATDFYLLFFLNRTYMLDYYPTLNAKFVAVKVKLPFQTTSFTTSTLMPH